MSSCEPQKHFPAATGPCVLAAEWERRFGLLGLPPFENRSPTSFRHSLPSGACCPPWGMIAVGHHAFWVLVVP